MTEQVIIEFIPDFSKLETGLDQVAKTGKVDVKSFKDLQAAIDTTATDTQGLIKQFKDVGGAAVKMGQSVEQAFGEGIQDALDQAGVSVKEFEAALKKANTPAASVKKELMALKNEMAKLKAEGKDTGKEFDTLRNRAGKLSDAIADANAEIKNAGSDTRNIDNVVGSISALAGGYAAVQGAAALFGEENEDLQKALLKVNGAMALATGLQQVLTAVQKEGAVTKLADSVATGAQTAATSLYTFVLGGATVATRIFRAALLATGIGALVVVVIALVNAMSDFGEETETAADAQERLAKATANLNEALEQQINLTNDIADLNILRAKAAGKTEAEITAIERKAITDRIALRAKAIDQAIKEGLTISEITKQQSDDITALQKFDLEQQIKALKAREAANEARKKAEEKIQAELKKLKDEEIEHDNEIARYKKKVNDEIYENEMKHLAKMRAAQVAFYNRILEDFKKSRADEKAEWERLDNERRESMAKSSDIEIARRKSAADAQLAETIQNAQNSIAIAERVASVFTLLTAAQTAQSNAMIANKRKEVDELLKAGAITAKAAEARQKQIDKLEARAKQQQAEREKKAAVFQAVLSIPKAFLQGLSQGGVYLAAVYAALAAVEAAVIISQPVPKFFRGKKDNYAGPGVVGDMGSEIVERDGRMFLYTKPTQTYLGAKDKVYTAGETKKILHNTSISTTIKPAKQEKFDYDRFAKAIPANAVNINIDKDFITESVAKGLTQNKYMDRRYSSR